MYLYLHGFNSSGDSAKGKYLREALAPQRVQTPSYPAQPDAAIAMLQEQLQYMLRDRPKDEPLILIGSSLGGFYAQYLAHRYALAKVLINPALQPQLTLLPHTGRQTNFYTGEQYDFTDRDLTQLVKFDVPSPCRLTNPSLVLLDAGDELIDYHQAQHTYAACARVIVYPGGDHQFQHMVQAVSAIKEFATQIV